MGLTGWIEKKQDIIQGRMHRLHYPYRDLHRWASVLLRSFGKEEYKLRDLKTWDHLHGAIKKDFKKRLIQDEKGIKSAFHKILNSVDHIDSDIIIIFNSVIRTLGYLLTEDKKIDTQVNIQEIEQRAMNQFPQLIALCNTIGNALEAVVDSTKVAGILEENADIIKAAAHRAHYPIRDLYRNSVPLLRDVKHAEIYIKRFTKALHSHILPKLKKAEEKAEETFQDIIKELHTIGFDLVVIYHLIIKNLKDLIKEDKEIQKTMEEASNYLKEAESELENVISMAMKTGEALRSLARTG